MHTIIRIKLFFIFGNSYISPMGLKGAAYASVSAEMIVFLILFLSLFVKRRDVFQKIQISFTCFKELWNLSFPLMLQGLVALATWSVFFFWIEHMGIEELAISQTLRSMYFILFIPVFGFNGVTKTYVSNIYQSGTIEEVKMVIKKIIKLCFFILIPVVVVSYVLTEPFVLLINDSPELVEKTAEVYYIVGGALVVYGVAGILFAAVSGLGRTKASFMVELICVAIYYAVAYPLTHTENIPIKYVWLVEYVYFISLGIMSFIVIRRILKSNSYGT